MNKISSLKDHRKDWWSKRRLKYNKGLVIAGILAVICYCIVGAIFIPASEKFEVTLFSIAFQGIGYLIMMGIANIFYLLGYAVDLSANKDDSDEFREKLFNLGYWFSVALPFMIPLLLFLKFGLR